MSEFTPPPAADTLASQVAALHARLNELEGRTKLLSRSFWTRAFAAYGLVFVSGLLIAIPIYAVIFLFAILAGGMSP